MSEYVLEVLDGELAGQVISLGHDKLTLGRRPNNDVVLKDEKASGNHAEVVKEGDAWVLRDLDSRNGTFLDGRKVTEISLSPGDVFKVGLTGVRFRRAGEAPVAVAGDNGVPAVEGISLHRVDQARLQRVGRGRGMLPLVAALVLVAGAGAWVYWQYGGGREPGRPQGQKRTTVVAGNLLSAEVATFDSDGAWDLTTAGASFAVGGPAHSGGNALAVTRGDGPAFALARLREPLRVISDDALELSGQVRCEHGASVVLRVLFSSSREEETLALLAGTKTLGAESWERLGGTVTVPAGMDRARVEVVALLPKPESAASVDDVALVKSEGGKVAPLVAKNGVRLLTSGASAALVLAQNVLVQALRPLPPAGSPLAALDGAARATLAEAGGTLQASVQEDTFSLVVQGTEGFAVEVPFADGILARAEPGGPFAAAPAEGTVTAAEVLIGSGPTRVLLALAAPVAVTGRSAPGGFRLALPGTTELRAIVGFEEERRQARERVRVAKTHAQGGRFAAALASLQEVVERFPHDDAVLSEAQQLRAEIRQGLSAKLDKLTQDLDTAKFFAARTGLDRVRADLDALVEAYGEVNLSGAGGESLAQRVRSEVGKLIADLDAQALQQRAVGLRSLAEALQQSGQTELAGVIESYLKERERND